MALTKKLRKKFMVFDLGGGTFDISILEIGSDVIEVMATSGNNRLGGDDFDACIVDYLVKEFQREQHIDLHKDMAAMQRVREAAEKAKIELSGITSASINLPFLTADKNGPKHMETTLTRAKFDELTAHLVEKNDGARSPGDAGCGHFRIGLKQSAVGWRQFPYSPLYKPPSSALRGWSRLRASTRTNAWPWAPLSRAVS